MDVVELGHVASLLEEANADPDGRMILRSLSDPASYAHEILVLATCRLLRSWGNAVQLKVTGRSSSADLLVTSPYVAVELKAPQELADNDFVVLRRPAAVAEAALQAARQQLRTRPTSMLIVAGYRIPAFVRSSLSDQLAERVTRRHDVAATVVISFGAHWVDWPDDISQRDLRALQVAVGIHRNEHYSGGIPIIDAGAIGEGLRLPGQSMIIRRTVS